MCSFGKRVAVPWRPTRTSTGQSQSHGEQSMVRVSPMENSLWLESVPWRTVFGHSPSQGGEQSLASYHQRMHWLSCHFHTGPYGSYTFKGPVRPALRRRHGGGKTDGPVYLLHPSEISQRLLHLLPNYFLAQNYSKNNKGLKLQA